MSRPDTTSRVIAVILLLAGLFQIGVWAWGMVTLIARLIW